MHAEIPAAFETADATDLKGVRNVLRTDRSTAYVAMRQEVDG